MKKSIVLLLLIVALAVVPVMAEDHGAGRSKLGTILGKGVFVTYGIPTGEATELNMFVGTDWSINYIDLGANLLFKLVDVNIEGETFPLSLGPQADVRIPFNNSSNIGLGILADLRWEYTFNFPLNLFIEIGLGIDMDFGNTVNMDFGWDGGLGVRYVF